MGTTALHDVICTMFFAGMEKLIQTHIILKFYHRLLNDTPTVYNDDV